MPDVTYQPGVELRFNEPGGSPNFVCLKGPDTIPADVVFKLPAADGAIGEVMKTNGSGQWSFGPMATTPIPPTVALTDVTNTWTMPQIFNQVVYTGQYFIAIRNGTNGGGPLNHQVLAVQTDGRTIGDGCFMTFASWNSSNTPTTYAHISMEIVDPTAGAEKSKLVFYTRRTGPGPGGMQPAFIVHPDGAIESGYQKMGSFADPNGNVSAPTGSTYQNLSGGAGTTFWVKESSPTASTGWVAK